MRESFQMRESDIEVRMMLSWRNGGSNLGIEDGANSECTKMIKLFMLKVDYHISHCWVLKMLLCWDMKPKNTTFSLMEKDACKASNQRDKIKSIFNINRIKVDKFSKQAIL